MKTLARILKGALVCGLALLLGGPVFSQAKTPITFTFFNRDGSAEQDSFQTRIAKEITKATGVTLKAEYPTGDIGSKMGLMIASGDFPDLIYAGDDQPKLVEAGALIKLDDLIEKHAPNIKKLFGDDLKRLRLSKDDPSIYVIGSYAVKNNKYSPSMGFQLQHQAVKAAGYPQLRTLADAEKVIADYVKKNPTTKDGKPTIGLTLIYEDWRWMSAVGNMAAFVTGKPDDGQWYVDPKTLDATYRFTMPDHRLYFKWLNHMNDIGLLDKESFTQKYDQYTAKISSGRVVALNDQLWQYSSAADSLKNTAPEQMYGVYPVQATTEFQSRDFQSQGYSGGRGVGISVDCKDPVRAIQFLDWCASEEAQVLGRWGQAGIDYTVVNGKRTLTPADKTKRQAKDYNKTTGLNVWVYPFPEWGDGNKGADGQFVTTFDPSDAAANYTAVEKETLAKYKAKIWKDLYPAPETLPKSTWGAAWQVQIPSDSDLKVDFEKWNNLVKQAIAKAVMAKPADFDAIWDKLQADLKAAGVEKGQKEFSNLLRARVALWK